MTDKPTIELHSQDKDSSYILLFRPTGTFEKKRQSLRERIKQLRQSCIVNTEYKNFNVYKAFYIPVISGSQLTMTELHYIGMWKLCHLLWVSISSCIKRGG